MIVNDNYKLCHSYKHNNDHKEGKSAAIFYRLLGAWVPDMFCNFYLVKSHEIANNLATTETIEKISTDLESLEF